MFIPHCQIQSASEELVLKISVNGSDWTTQNAMAPTSNITDSVV